VRSVDNFGEERRVTDSVNEQNKRWAWIAGASDGLGLAFANVLASRGYSLVLIARRREVLEAEAERIRERYGVSVSAQTLDLSDIGLEGRLKECLKQSTPSIAIYNAAYVPIGDYLAQPLDNLLRAIDVNVRGPLIWSRLLGEAMLTQREHGERNKTALVFMSSLAGEQGSPRIAAYAASKAFNTILAEGLWSELRDKGIDVLVCTAGAIRTPGYQDSSSTEAPGTIDAATLAVTTLDSVGNGPRVAPGWINKMAALIVGRWLPRRTAIGVMARTTKDLNQPNGYSRGAQH